MESQQLVIQMALKAWKSSLSRADKYFDLLSDEGLLKEVAPGKNRVVYLLGHLIAVHDNLIPLFGLGDRLYTSLDEAFLKNPDKSGLPIPEPAELRAYWKKINEVLATYFAGMSADDWFSKHTAVSEEDFSKDPTRNKLNVLMGRTNHLSYHLGQLILVN